MPRSNLPRIFALSVVLAHVAIACDGGDLNPQPLPPKSGGSESSDPDRGNEGPTSGSDGNGATPGAADAGAQALPDGGDAGDGG